jgi:hypothetical protein
MEQFAPGVACGAILTAAVVIVVLLSLSNSAEKTCVDWGAKQEMAVKYDYSQCMVYDRNGWVTMPQFIARRLVISPSGGKDD